MVISEIPVRYRLFLCVFLLYLPFVYSTTWSENDATLRQTIALVDSGTIQIGKVGQMDPTVKHLIRLSQFRVVGEAVYAKTSAGLSYFLAPVYFVLKPLLPRNQRERIFLLDFLLAVFVAAPLGALTIVLFYDIIRTRGLTKFDSLFLSLCLAFATNHFPFSLALKQRSIVEFLIILVLWMQFAHHHEKSGIQTGRPLATGIVIGLIPIMNYSGIIYWPALFLYLFICMAGENW